MLLLRSLSVCPSMGLWVVHNSSIASVTRTKRMVYPRTYPTLLVYPDGSTITIRYKEPRRIIKVQINCPLWSYAFLNIQTILLINVFIRLSYQLAHIFWNLIMTFNNLYPSLQSKGIQLCFSHTLLKQLIFLHYIPLQLVCMLLNCYPYVLPLQYFPSSSSRKGIVTGLEVWTPLRFLIHHAPKQITDS